MGEVAVNQLRQRLGAERTHIAHLLAKRTTLGLLPARRAGRQLFYSAVDAVLINPNLVKRLSQYALAETPAKSTQPSHPHSLLP